MRRFVLLIVFLPLLTAGQQLRWTNENSFLTIAGGEVIRLTLPNLTKDVVVSRQDLNTAAPGSDGVMHFSLSKDGSKLLLFANTKKVWRLETKGDYFVMDIASKKISRLGKSLPPSSLMFAKFSPDQSKVAYVSEYNVYVEDLASGTVTALTTDGNRKHINGTFDWAYEEEFSCRDGIQWSPDSKRLAYWQIDATRIRDFYMINNTDSVYSKVVPVEYPTAGQTPSPARVGVVEIATGKTAWVPLPGDPAQHYIPRIEWNTSGTLYLQQMNRKQNETIIYSYVPSSGAVKSVYTDHDDAWIDTFTPWEDVYALDFRHELRWINDGKEFIWFSEQDGWRHVYRVSTEGKSTLITKGNYDVMDVKLIDEKGKYLYFIASPTNATQKYLYRCKLDGSGQAERVTPKNQEGTHEYQLGPSAKFAFHAFSNISTQPLSEWITLPQHKAINEKSGVDARLASAKVKTNVQFFKVKTADGTEMDGWMAKPANFDSTKRYPVLFLVYTEPWHANVTDEFGIANNHLFQGDLAEEGYLYIAVDNRGTPSPKGRTWRKSIYRNIGTLNIQDQAAAAREIRKWKFVDPTRIAVWGWSGGGSATLNLMFQFPDLYQTGIAVAAVANALTYDNIYQERFMGLPQENMADYIKGSPVTYAKNLKGNLLYIHGTGDDNVHYANAEMLINELVKQGKQFQLMIYPNRTHSISEGEGTTEHLSTLYTSFLRKNCPGGGR